MWRRESFWLYRDFNSDHLNVQTVASRYADWTIVAHERNCIWTFSLKWERERCGWGGNHCSGHLPCEIGVGSAIKQSIPHMFSRMVSKTNNLINSFNLEPVPVPLYNTRQLQMRFCVKTCLLANDGSHYYGSTTSLPGRNKRGSCFNPGFNLLETERFLNTI
jgi:hypothetical protein